KVLVLGITFKENCPDIRNSKVIDIVREFQTYGVDVEVYDPWASAEEVLHEYDLELLCKASLLRTDYEGIVLAVSHKAFLDIDLSVLKGPQGVVFDVKSLYAKDLTDARL